MLIFTSSRQKFITIFRQDKQRMPSAWHPLKIPFSPTISPAPKTEAKFLNQLASPLNQLNPP
jgi:hypothetical protein